MLQGLSVLCAGAIFCACSDVTAIETLAPPAETTLQETTSPPITTIEEIPLQTLSPMEKSPTQSIARTPFNPEADASAQELMAFLSEQYGKAILTGQYISTPAMPEIYAIETVTGRRPAMLLADLSENMQEREDSGDIVSTAISWGESGGLVSLMWHWEAPIGGASVYTEQTSFDIAKAVTNQQIAMASPEEIQSLYESGNITEETAAVIRDIDAVSEKLKRLQEKGVAVLWRPLHEASGGWFWWGSKGKDAYLWLWKLLVERQTKFHKLNNLLWVWNGQAADWYVGDNFCDVISADIYTENEKQATGAEIHTQLNTISNGKKMLAVSECGMIPDPDALFSEKSVWSFFGLWYGEYILDKTDAFSPQFTSRERLIKAYNSEATLTLDELPGFSSQE